MKKHFFFGFMLLILVRFQALSQDIAFSSEYNKIYFPLTLGVQGGITGDDYQYKKLVLYHGHSIVFETGTNAPNNTFNRMMIGPGGYIGMGTGSPVSRLDARSNSSYSQANDTDIAFFGSNDATNPLGLALLHSAYGSREHVSLIGTRHGLNGKDIDINLDQGGSGGMTIQYRGNVGIGTTNPTERLSVNGTVRAKEIKVESSPWPDYVFHPSYTLKPLADVNKYIQENGHLPGMPSAEEVKKDGIALGEMNAKLLEKIEELTLYLIEKDKQMQKLQSEMETLRKQTAPVRQ